MKTAGFGFWNDGWRSLRATRAGAGRGGAPHPLRSLLLVAPALLLAGLAAPLALGAQEAPESLFYYVDDESSFRSFEAHVDRISVVGPSAYSVDEDGVVWGDVDPRVLELAEEHGVDVMPLIVNPGFDQQLAHDFLNDSTARRRAIESLVAECRRHGYSGFQIDFENIAIEDRAAFTRFFEEAAAALHGADLEISAAVVHRYTDHPGPTTYHKWLFKNWRAGYDLAALAEAGDFLSVMTYAQHTRRTPPGPQAGIPWVRKVVEYYLQEVPPEKLSLGIPLGSQHWYTRYEEDLDPEKARSYSESVSFRRATSLVERQGAELQWSEEHQVPFAFYANGGTYEWVFMEDARSFAAKLDLVREYGLRGFSAWVLGREDPGIWDRL